MYGCAGQLGLTGSSALAVGVNVNLFLLVYMCQPLINCHLGQQFRRSSDRKWMDETLLTPTVSRSEFK